MVRPHVPVVVLAALAVAVVFRRRRSQPPVLGPVGRIVTIVVLMAAMAFVLGQAVDRLLPNSEATSTTEAVGELLDRAESGTDGGGSQIDRPTPNTPLEYPGAVLSVLFRPTILEADSAGNVVAAVETTLVLALVRRVVEAPAQPADDGVPPPVRPVLPRLHRDLRLRLVVVLEPRCARSPTRPGVAVRPRPARASGRGPVERTSREGTGARVASSHDGDDRVIVRRT